MYNRGTLSEFNTWHNAAMIAEGLPKIGFVNGHAAPQNQETIAYSEAIQNPDKSDDYIWMYGAYPAGGKAQLTQADINNLNWFPDN